MTHFSSMPNHRNQMIKSLLKNNKTREFGSGVECSIMVKNARLDLSQLRAYNRYFGFSDNIIPLPFWFVFSQPAQLALFNHTSFPTSVLGLVHLGLTIERINMGSLDADYHLGVDLIQTKSTTRGLLIKVKIVIQNEKETIAVIESDYLSPNKNTTKRRVEKKADRFDCTDARMVEYNVAKARKYAKLSGDYNPIHLHSLLSRLFGFRQPILHGMYSVASLYAYCYKRNLGSDKQMRVKFKRPLLLPQTAYILQMDTRGYLLNSDAKCCVEMVW
ncbi:MaoC/PaaZ C-terminal domain-containing protein [Vibrio sp. FNV 38]|nr:MaoC/PaaZ C-terminal domain-containing protein [Vibrio sp. FNV 38]